MKCGHKRESDEYMLHIQLGALEQLMYIWIDMK